MRQVLIVLFCIGAQAAVAAPARITCWTDENGNRACGDRVPPQYAKQERQVYDDTGRLVDVQAREKTAEELAAQARQAEDAAREQARAEEQARQDSFLLQAYQSVEDVIATRDSRVLVLNGRLGLLEKSIRDSEGALDELRARADKLVADAKPVPAKLEKQLADFEDNLARQRTAAEHIHGERDQIVEKAAEDIIRYRELKGLPAAAVPPPPSHENVEVAEP